MDKAGSPPSDIATMMASMKAYATASAVEIHPSSHFYGNPLTGTSTLL
jgi:hypothetical protein